MSRIPQEARRLILVLIIAVSVLIIADPKVFGRELHTPRQHHSVVTDYNDGFVDGESQCGMGPRG